MTFSPMSALLAGTAIPTDLISIEVDKKREKFGTEQINAKQVLQLIIIT